jgi:hypothetical protein
MTDEPKFEAEQHRLFLEHARQESVHRRVALVTQLTAGILAKGTNPGVDPGALAESYLDRIEIRAEAWQRGAERRARDAAQVKVLREGRIVGPPKL